MKRESDVNCSRKTRGLISLIFCFQTTSKNSDFCDVSSPEEQILASILTKKRLPSCFRLPFAQVGYCSPATDHFHFQAWRFWPSTDLVRPKKAFENFKICFSESLRLSVTNPNRTE